jgi:hypothetical protein
MGVSRRFHSPSAGSRWPRPFLLLLLVLLSACGARTLSLGAIATEGESDASDKVATHSDCILVASSFDQSCEVDNECIGVVLGDVCSSDVCLLCKPNAAINRDSEGDYMAALETRYRPKGACRCQPTEQPCCDRNLGRCGLLPPGGLSCE